MTSRLLRALALAPILAFTLAPAQTPKPTTHHLDMTPARPESVGFDSQRLERLHALMQQAVDDKHLAGVVTILARHGKVVDYRTYGTRDMASNTPMTKDTIFRDYSMTKPVTAVAMMILFEQGKWLPNDPIAKYIPEFAHLKVYAGQNDDGTPKLVDPDHQPTMAELMSHTAGFTYGLFGNTPVDKLVRDAKLFESANLQEFIDKTAKLPLLYQPGKGWTYSISMDIEGYIVEKLSGQSLPDFCRDHIYQPLGMKDAGFFVPKDKWPRFATLYYHDAKTGGLTTENMGGVNYRPYTVQPPMPSGGGGMVSTAEDYYRFAQMLAYNGDLDGHRILAPASVRLMTTNHVPEPLMTQGFGIGYQQIRPGFGYGYNCAVEYDPQLANLPEGKGTFLWDGAAGTWFWIDPANDIVFVGMIQRIGGGEPNVQYLSRSLVYQALTDPSR
jgi:CubicO group peptidase (beta-lactamase class C family)